MKKNRRTSGWSRDAARRGLAAMTVGLAAGAGIRAEATGERPNILLIIADDYGVDSHPLYNASPDATFPPTPNIDRLYTNGVMFRNFYAYPTSSPTRSCLLTGRFGFRTGIGYALETTNDPGLASYEFTIPEVLQAAGANYDCAMFGKWHASLNDNADPNTLGGFPLFMGSMHGGFIPPDNYYSWPFVSNGVENVSTNYATIATTEDAIRWIQSRPPGSNWLCWVAYNASHTPYHKPPNELCPSYASLTGTHAHISQNPRLYYEAMTEGLDWGVGRLLTNVDLQTTTVMFLGDNGTLGVSPVTERRIIQLPYDTDRAKGTLYQGGLRAPLFIAGAGVSNLMRECTNLVCAVDLFATILDLAGVPNPADFLPAPRPLDGRSFAAVLGDPAAAPHRSWALAENFSEHTESNRAGRCLLDNRCKYIEFRDGSKAFYDLSSDPYELTNLYGQALSSEQSNSLETLRIQLNDLQNYPRLTAARAAPDEVAIAFINAVDFTLWSAPAVTGEWEHVVDATVATNETEVRFSALPDAGERRFYRAGAPSR